MTQSPSRSTTEAAEPAVAPPPGNPRFDHLDALRACAALSVVLCHATAGTPGFPDAPHASLPLRLMEHLSGGVTLFFLLSGFLLYRPFAQARSRGEAGPPAPRFWWRRVLRIVPAYWLALTVLAIWPGLRGVHTGDWWRYYLLVQTFSVHTVLGGLSQAWTLCVEAQFYLLLPLFAVGVAAVGRRFGRRAGDWAEVAGLVTVFAASVVDVHHHVYATHAGGAAAAVRYDTLLCTVQWFVLGMALAVLSVRDPAGHSAPATYLRHPAGTAICWAAAAAVFCLQALSSASPTAQQVLLGLFGVLVVAPPMLAPSGRRPQAILTHPIAAWLGLVSYGIYLWHGEIVYKLLSWGVGGPGALGALEVFAVAAPAATAVAAVSYYALERPILRLKNRSPAFAARRHGSSSYSRPET